MKLSEAKTFYRTLSLICFPLIILLIVRRLMLIELEIISILTGFFWPVVGTIITILFLKRDGYTTSASEIMFFFFILYCAIYLIFPSISMLINPDLGQNIVVLILNFAIIGLGWVGIAYYAIY